MFVETIHRVNRRFAVGGREDWRGGLFLCAGSCFLLGVFLWERIITAAAGVKRALGTARTVNTDHVNQRSTEWIYIYI